MGTHPTRCLHAELAGRGGGGGGQSAEGGVGVGFVEQLAARPSQDDHADKGSTSGMYDYSTMTRRLSVLICRCLAQHVPCKGARGTRLSKADHDS